MFEAVNAATAVATLVVLSAAALAALIQLRHMQAGNQLQIFIDLFSRAQSAEMQAIFDMVPELSARIQDDPEYVRQIARSGAPLRNSPLRLAFWFDEVGIALRQHLISPKIIFQVGASAQTTVRSWLAMQPIIAAVRARSPGAFLHFEYAAVCAKQWLDAHPEGDYPTGVPRWDEVA